MSDIRELIWRELRENSATEADLQRVQTLVDKLFEEKEEFFLPTSLNNPVRDVTAGLIVENHHKGRSASVKVGNIRWNLRLLPELFAEYTNLGLKNLKVLPSDLLVILHLIQLSIGTITVELSLQESLVVESLWRNGAETKEIDYDIAYDRANELLRSRHEATLSGEEFSSSIAKLETLQTVEHKEGRIILKEMVMPRY